MYDIVLVRYGEIGLKGKNRSAFEERLVQNLRRAVLGFSGCIVRRAYGRILIEPPSLSKEEMGRLLSRLESVFGVVSVSPAKAAPLDLGAILETAKTLTAERLRRAGSESVGFKVETRRSNKRFPKKSPEINREIGGRLLEAFDKLYVDVHRPSFIVHIEVRDQAAYVYTDVLHGPGGLPVGASSRGLLLLSGGIDSPVAGWMAMKRGVKLDAVHFHSFPYTSDRSKEKVLDLARILSRYGDGPIPVHVVHFTEVQTAIRKNVPAAMGITVMRRMMFRIAERIARTEGISALVTGESIGQVASQTLESMAAINAVTTMPVLRPLVAMDKTEIVEVSNRIGTYETSILPYEDCCTVFVPDHPETKPRIDRVLAAEERLDVPALVEEAVEKTERVRVDERDETMSDLFA